MTQRLLRRWLTLAAVPVLIATAATPVRSQESQGYAREGGYVAVSGLLDFTFDGVTFDGETAYVEVGGKAGHQEVMILPRLNKRNLIRAMLGHRWEKAALEVSYDRTHHDGTFMDETTEATFQSVNIDGRFFMATRGPVQPYVLVGGAVPWLTIKDGSFLDPNVGDARVRGYGVNTEGGVTVFPTPRVGIGVGYAYRMMWFDRASGVSDRLFDLRPRFRETSGSVVLSGSFTF
jgi:hypothetical protein